MLNDKLNIKDAMRQHKNKSQLILLSKKLIIAESSKQKYMIFLEEEQKRRKLNEIDNSLKKLLQEEKEN